jgi:GNAT superfamily N-acetyltransferase
MFAQDVTIRRAGRPHLASLLSMQADSFRTLGRTHYPADAIESFIRHIGTMDTSLLDEGHYFVAELGGEIAACGGWSTRTPRYAAFDKVPRSDKTAEPVMRSVFVHPDRARLGLGSLVMKFAEADIRASGHRAATLMALLSAREFYRRLGFSETGSTELTLPDGTIFACATMRKRLVADTPAPVAV